MKTEDEKRAMLKRKAVEVYKQFMDTGLGYGKAKDAAVKFVEEKKKEFDDTFEVDDDVEKCEKVWTARMDQFDTIIKMIKAL